MRHERDGLELVRSELIERLESLRRMARWLSAGEFAERVEAMRSLASAYGLIAVARLAEALGRAIGESGSDIRACPTALYLAQLRDAIGCEPLDERATQTILASVSVRLSG
jgi:hypothetical protein